MLKSYYQVIYSEAGCDEAGRGCLAGPVYAAAVILPRNFQHPFLNDSKQLSAKKRNELRDEIIEKAVSWSVASSSVEEIENINILKATHLAMHRAIDGLKIEPEFLIIDGNSFKKYHQIPSQCIIKGDSKYFSIAAASILAKTFRDDYMIELSKEFPVYGWHTNKGYPTEFHRNAIIKSGICEHHRKSFNLLNVQYELQFTK